MIKKDFSKINLEPSAKKISERFYETEGPALSAKFRSMSISTAVKRSLDVPIEITKENLMKYLKVFYPTFFEILNSNPKKIEIIIHEDDSKIGLKVTSLDDYGKLKNIDFPLFITYLLFYEVEFLDIEDTNEFVLDFIPSGVDSLEIREAPYISLVLDIKDCKVKDLQISYVDKLVLRNLPSSLLEFSTSETNYDINFDPLVLKNIELESLTIGYNTSFGVHEELNIFVLGFKSIKRFYINEAEDLTLLPKGLEFFGVNYEFLEKFASQLKACPLLTELELGPFEGVFNPNLIPPQVRKLYFTYCIFYNQVQIPDFIEDYSMDDSSEFTIFSDENRSILVQNNSSYDSLINPKNLIISCEEEDFDASLVKSYSDTIESLHVESASGTLVLNNDLVNLQKLSITDTSFDFVEGFKFSDDLTSIELFDCETEKIEFPQTNEGLLTLNISCVDRIDSFKGFSSTIKKIVLDDNVRVDELPPLPQDLEELEITSFQYLWKLPLLKKLSKLKRVVIKDCPRLESFPMFDSNTLEELIVEDCPMLKVASRNRIDKFNSNK